jgi:hypothetical protein
LAEGCQWLGGVISDVEKGDVVFCGFYGYLCSQVHVKRYDTAYMCLSPSGTYALLAFEVSVVCHRTHVANN